MPTITRQDPQDLVQLASSGDAEESCSLRASITGRNRLALLLASVAFWSVAWLEAADTLTSPAYEIPRHFVTNVAQFRALSGGDFLAGCDFSLTGVVTLVDASRDLVVVQDSSGAVALHFPIQNKPLEVGQLAQLDGSNCSPLFVSFPDFPHRPSGSDLRNSFEGPQDWGNYHLTRMRGWLRPPVTGNYRFWIASDNSSELWLSTDASPAKTRRIASIARFNWVNPYQWNRFPSQRSELIPLKADELYYLEALQEQTSEGDHLAVAWQVPSPNESAIEIIDGRFLTPWSTGPNPIGNNGVLREYWTNYTAGDLTGLGGPRPFESALSVREVVVQDLGRGTLPKPMEISLNQPLAVEANYCWVQAEGAVTFNAADDDGGFLEIADGHARAQVRVNQLSPALAGQLSNAVIRVRGVCEGIQSENGTLAPGLIWVSVPTNISLVESMTTNAVAEMEQPLPAPMATGRTMRGFFGTRGVVTFNDRVLGRDYIIIQEDTTVMLVNVADKPFKNRLKAGRRVDLGGDLEPGKELPILTPLFVADMGQRSMPWPITPALGSSIAGNIEGRWSEMEGVVHSVNSNGTLRVQCKGGTVNLWLGQTPADSLPDYVDARVRARGALLTTLLDAPVLLIPSRNFLAVEVPPPGDPFGLPRQPIAGLLSDDARESWRSHRVRIIGEVTYRDDQSFFIQDDSGGIRVRTGRQPTVKTGETVEVVAFPALSGFSTSLTEPLLRRASPIQGIRPRGLDLSEALSSRQGGHLVQVEASLLARKTNSLGQVLELQEQQRVFVALLTTGKGDLPDLLPGSRLRITGVCDDELTAPPPVGERSARAQPLASLSILLRSPQDVAVLSGPPWWTWKRTAALVGALLVILIVSLLWVHLLHRRLERQKAARLAFSRQVLEKLEDERSRIAANLHDSLGQTLLVVKNHAMLALQRPPNGDGLRQRLDEISCVTSQAIEEVRRITHGLRPYQLDRLGLTQAIRASVNRASENGTIVFASRVEDIDGLLGKDAEIHVYRIVQEAITNVVKHSSATEAAVVIKRRDNSISVSIRDNGRGFEPAKSSASLNDLGYGLTGIAERVQILAGTVSIDSRPGSGTSLSVEVPFSPSPK